MKKVKFPSKSKSNIATGHLFTFQVIQTIMSSIWNEQKPHKRRQVYNGLLVVVYIALSVYQYFLEKKFLVKNNYLGKTFFGQKQHLGRKFLIKKDL